jgi:hypothetical protein
MATAIVDNTSPYASKASQLSFWLTKLIQENTLAGDAINALPEYWTCCASVYNGVDSSNEFASKLGNLERRIMKLPGGVQQSGAMHELKRLCSTEIEIDTKLLLAHIALLEIRDYDSDITRQDIYKTCALSAEKGVVSARTFQNQLHDLYATAEMWSCGPFVLNKIKEAIGYRCAELQGLKNRNVLLCIRN